MNRKRPIICVDFDGVIHSYTSGWKGVGTVSDLPMRGAIKWLQEYLDCPDSLCSMAPLSQIQIVIYSSRSRTRKGRRAMRKWFAKYLGREYLEVLKFPRKKPPAFLTIDDRAICFKGQFPSLTEMLDFRSYKEKP